MTAPYPPPIVDCMLLQVFPIERTVTTIDGLWVYGWPSKGGLIVLSDPTGVDFDYLGWDYLDPPGSGTRTKTPRTKSARCSSALERPGTTVDRATTSSRPLPRTPPALEISFFMTKSPLRRRVESLWVRVGWPSTGGLWVAEFINGAFEDVVDDSVEWNEQDGHYGNAAGQIVLAKDMDERCEILKRLGGRFYASLDDYHGNACLRVWEQKTTGEAGPLVRTRYVER
ncbi:hypothetical protein BDV11DRAFT_202407 [Aspergillus similis]